MSGNVKSLGVDSVGILFPGQGAQDVNMGRWLYENHPSAKALFEQANDLLGYDLSKLCFEGPKEKLDATQYSQPALFTVGMAAATVWAEENADDMAAVKAVAGLSLGEYTAVCFAGGLDFASGLELVRRRGEAMQAAADQVESGMASVLGLDLDRLTEICDQVREEGEVLEPANLLCPGNIAVSGHLSALSRLEPIALEEGAMKVVRLSVAGAFHTSLMSPAVEKLSAALAEMPIADTRIPVYSNVDAKTHQSATEIKSLLSKQVVNRVLWEASIRNMMDDGIEGFLELGTGRVLRGTLKRINRKTPADGFGDG